MNLYHFCYQWWELSTQNRSAWSRPFWLTPCLYTQSCFCATVHGKLYFYLYITTNRLHTILHAFIALKSASSEATIGQEVFWFFFIDWQCQWIEWNFQWFVCTFDELTSWRAVIHRRTMVKKIDYRSNRGYTADACSRLTQIMQYWSLHLKLRQCQTRSKLFACSSRPQNAVFR